MRFSIKSIPLLLAAGFLSFTACNDDGTNASRINADSSALPVDTSSQSNASTPATNSDQAFIDYVVPKNASEIAWLTAGMNHGNSKELKDHAKMMLADHKKLEGEVKDLITKKSMSMPAADTTNAVTINDKKGKDWDKAWTDKMVADHEEILNKLQSAQNDVQDADAKTLITNTIPVVQNHLKMAKAMQAKMK